VQSLVLIVSSGIYSESSDAKTHNLELLLQHYHAKFLSEVQHIIPIQLCHEIEETNLGSSKLSEFDEPKPHSTSLPRCRLECQRT
jgi:hypothetical protein